MKNLKIGTKIFTGFALVLLFLLAIAATSVISTVRTSANIDEVDVGSGLQNRANELMHILNETRVTAGVLYATQSPETHADISKQLMYSDLRLEKLYEYIDAYPETASFRPDIQNFQSLYEQWRDTIKQMGTDFPLEEGLSAPQKEAFTQLANEARRVNLLCHEKLSNTILSMGAVANRTMQQTKEFTTIGLYIVIVVSAASLVAAMVLAVTLRRSITLPLGHMRDVLTQIGQTGDLQIPQETQNILQTVADGKDETAQCTAALLVLMKQLNRIDKALASVANGNLTANVNLQSEQDTMGLAVKKMVENLNQKFNTIASSISRVHVLAGELDEGSQLLASGSTSQSESVFSLASSVGSIGEKTEKSAQLAVQAASLVGNIQNSAQTGTEKMNQMMQAASDINTASQAIGQVIKTINDIAFQTNILALNAAVEAARAGIHGKGFAVVADEVRNLATKSADAAKESGTLIEDTIQKAALGTSIAQKTAESLDMIVQGVVDSSTIIRDISVLSKEQEADVQQITAGVAQVEQIVEQNNRISSQSASASGEIAEQSSLLKELVTQFQLIDTAQNHPAITAGGTIYEN